MPNTVPQATTAQKVEEKFDIAAKSSWANYSFMFGGTNDNLKDLIQADADKGRRNKAFFGLLHGEYVS